jgi:hypothetical protein
MTLNQSSAVFPKVFPPAKPETSELQRFIFQLKLEMWLGVLAGLKF